MPASPTAFASGTQAASIGTEHTLVDIAVAGVFSVMTNLINMAAGDLYERRIYFIVLTGGARAVGYKSSRVDAQSPDDMIDLSVTFANELTDAGAIRVTLKQVLGTGRNFDWKVLRY